MIKLNFVPEKKIGHLLLLLFFFSFKSILSKAIPFSPYFNLSLTSSLVNIFFGVISTDKEAFNKFTTS